MEGKEDKSNGRAWYERDPNKPAWCESESISENIAEKSAEEKPEHKIYAMSEENANQEHDPPKESIGKKTPVPLEANVKKEPGRKKSEEKDGKIYLPEPPPKAFLSDKIDDPKRYIEKKLKQEKDRRKAEAKRERFERDKERYGSVNAAAKEIELKIAVFFLSIALIFAMVASLTENYFILLGSALSTAIFVLSVIVLIKRKRAEEEKFILVKPYAVEKCFGSLYNLSDEKKRREIRACSLRIYFIEKQEKKQAQTEFIFKEEELDSIVSAFLHGYLIVGAKVGIGDEVGNAIVFSPEYNIRTEL